MKGLQHTSYLTITAKKSGYIRCYANNSLGEDSAMSPYFVTGTSLSNSLVLKKLSCTMKMKTAIMTQKIKIEEKKRETDVDKLAHFTP